MFYYIDGKYGGVAPKAKIAFLDLAKGGGGLTGLPAKKLYLPGRAAGARIHTNSWGGYFRYIYCLYIPYDLSIRIDILMYHVSCILVVLHTMLVMILMNTCLITRTHLFYLLLEMVVICSLDLLCPLSPLLRI